MTRLEEKRFCSLPVRLTNFPHYVVGGNKLCKDVHTSVRDDITGSHMKPLVVGVEPPLKLGRGIDPVTEIVLRKRQWCLELNRQLSCVKRRRAETAETLQTYNKFCTHGKLGALMSEKKIKFIKHVGKDPDVNFDGCCNWYYCGGQLNHFKIDGKVILTSVQGRKYDGLHFIPLIKKGMWSAELGSAAVVTPVTGKTIFQVVSSELGYTVARCRNHIALYKLTLEDDVIVGSKCFTASSKEPFVNVDITTKYSNKICSVQTDRNLCVRDVNTQSKHSEHVSSHCTPSTREKWCAATFGISPHTLYYSDRSCIRCFDLRIGLSEHVACWCLRNCKLVEKCECIFNTVPSFQNANRVYVGTTHHMLTLDVRKKHDTVTSECWTHMLRTPPLYGCCSTGERELLVMASQESSEVEVFSDGSLLPVMLQSFTDYLRKSNSRGYNLEPDAQQRYRLSISGLTCIEDDPGKFPTVLVQTAAGDIFQHELRSSVDTLLHGSCDVGSHLQGKHSCKRLECSNILEMKYLQSVLQGNATMKQDCPDKIVRFTDKKFNWMASKEKLLSYRDLLASSILDTWDIDAMEEWGRSTKRKSNDFDIPPALHKQARALLQEW